MRDPIPTWTFALAIIRDGERVLLVEEHSHLGGWYLPGGRVEPGEDLEAAALREVSEETGISVQLEAIHRVQYTPIENEYARLRVIFLGRPQAGSSPKTIADEHTLSAGWFTLEEVATLPLRDPDVLVILRDVSRRARGHPLEILSREEYQ